MYMYITVVRHSVQGLPGDDGATGHPGQRGAKASKYILCLSGF